MLKIFFILAALLIGSVRVAGQEWAFDQHSLKAYEHVLNLEVDEARRLIPNPKTTQQFYILALAETLELILTEDAEKFTDYEERFEKRLERKLKLDDPHALFLRAELHLQWAFVTLKFGNEFDAARHIRQSYLTVQELKKKFSGYNAVKKTSGVLNIIIGSIPEKYNWLLSLLNMKGTVNDGLEELNDLRNAHHPLSFEAGLLSSFVQGFVLQQPDRALTEMTNDDNSYNRLSLFLGASLHLKNSDSEHALRLLTRLTEQHAGLPLSYADYLKGEIFLHKSAYNASIASYHSFLNHYAGQNHRKDALYKIGLCHWLNGNRNEAMLFFKQAKITGKEATEADKHAARSLAEKEWPHIALTKARYCTDGGYYEEAKKILEDLDPSDLPSKRDQVEYYYRKARVAHKAMDFSSARRFYQQTIDTNGTEEWYFAPNACLQLGYIAMLENDVNAAKLYFTKALNYKKHVYKNSIDSKAKAAMARLGI